MGVTAQIKWSIDPRRGPIAANGLGDRQNVVFIEGRIERASATGPDVPNETRCCGTETSGLRSKKACDEVWKASSTSSGEISFPARLGQWSYRIGSQHDSGFRGSRHHGSGAIPFSEGDRLAVQESGFDATATAFGIFDHNPVGGFAPADYGLELWPCPGYHRRGQKRVTRQGANLEYSRPPRDTSRPRIRNTRSSHRGPHVAARNTRRRRPHKARPGNARFESATARD